MSISSKFLLLNLSAGLILTSLRPASADAATNVLAVSPYIAGSDSALKAGDVVFIHIGGPLFSRIAATSKGWVSHVGIIVGQENGEWMVAEGAVPFSRKTSLHSFIARSSTGQFAIKRFKSEMTPSQVTQLNVAADHRLGKVYDFGFKLDSTRSTFCSKFVYQVVKESTGQELGDVANFRTILTQNPNLPIWFWKAWFMGRIPWERQTVTPQSQFESPLMVSVCANT